MFLIRSKETIQDRSRIVSGPVTKLRLRSIRTSERMDYIFGFGPAQKLPI